MKLHLLAVFAIVGVVLISVTPARSAECFLVPSITGIVEGVNANPALRTVTLSYKLENWGNLPVCLCKWNTMLDNAFWAAAVGLIKDGRPKYYDTPVMPYHTAIADGDFQFIDRVGDARVAYATADRDLSTVFKFVKNVKYTVEVQTYPLDCREVADLAACTRRLAAEWTLKPFSTIYRRYTPNEDITKPLNPSLAIWLAAQNNPAPRIEVGVMATIGAANQAQHNALKAAFALSKTYIASAMDSLFLTDVDETATDLYETWFGDYYQPYHGKVLQCFGQLSGHNDKIHVFQVITGTDMCPPYVAAYVWATLSNKKQHLIHLCADVFFYTTPPVQRALLDFANAGVKEEFAHTILHERTHDTCGTEDEKQGCQTCYGAGLCQTLAFFNPEKAITNADSYAFFGRNA